LAAAKMGFQAIQKKLAGNQKQMFMKACHNFYVVLANKEIHGMLHGTSQENCNIDFESVIPYAFPSQQYVQSAFVKRMLD
jgi:hypothetical protein